MIYNNNYNRILLIGFRCTGKSTIGLELAKILNFEFLDIDSLIENEQGKTIKEITENGKNWSIFREIETLKIKELLNFDNIVISAGGGLGVNNVLYDNFLTYGDIQREIIKSSFDTLKILLEADENIIAKRLINGMDIRPDLSIQTFNDSDYIDNNLTMMKEREENYKDMADIIINTNSEDTCENVNKIIDAINIIGRK